MNFKRTLLIVSLACLTFALFFASCAKRASMPASTSPAATRNETAPATPASLGSQLYHSPKFRCYQCHGMSGEGGKGPSLAGIAKKLPPDVLAEKAHHMCPPSRVCNPREFHAILKYLQTL